MTKTMTKTEWNAVCAEIDRCAAIGEKHGFVSRWSMLDGISFDAPHPFAGAKVVLYDEHWGGEGVGADIDGPTWLDLWRAADKAISASGDQHHVFIERFTQDGTALRLTTGS
jgi:hypothetical protein